MLAGVCGRPLIWLKVWSSFKRWNVSFRLKTKVTFSVCGSMRPIELVLLLIPTEDGHHSRDHEEAAGRETSTNSKSLWGETKPEVHRQQQVPPQIANYCTGIHFSTWGHVAVLRKGKLINQQKVFSGFLSAYLISFSSHYEMISQNSPEINK